MKSFTLLDSGQVYKDVSFIAFFFLINLFNLPRGLVWIGYLASRDLTWELAISKSTSPSEHKMSHMGEKKKD